jgi:hypothetical protein
MIFDDNDVLCSSVAEASCNEKATLSFTANRFAAYAAIETLEVRKGYCIKTSNLKPQWSFREEELSFFLLQPLQ